MPVPPITIGELTDVPTYDSPIASPWAQEVTRRAAHRFASTGERDAKYPANTAGAGAICVAAGVFYISNGATWQGRLRIYGSIYSPSDSGFPDGIPAGTTQDVPMCFLVVPTPGIVQLDLVAGLVTTGVWSAFLKVKKTPTAGSPITVPFQFWVNGSTHSTVDVHPLITVAAGDNLTVTITYGTTGTGTINWFADPVNFQFSAELGQI